MRSLDLAEIRCIDRKKVSIKFSRFEVIEVSVVEDEDRRRFVSMTYQIDDLQSVLRRQTPLSKSATIYAKIAEECRIDAAEYGTIEDVTPQILLTLMTLDD